MNVLERYIFRRLIGALALCFVALSMTVWVTQALRQFDLVTSRGQSLLTFLEASLFLVPTLTIVVVPASLLIAVIYTLNSLNSDSELAIINASGARQRILMKPIVLTAVGAVLIVASCTLHFVPWSLREARSLLEQVNSDIVGQFIREGQFLSIGDGVTINIKRRNPDGTLDSIFVSDKRDDEEWSTYLARRGQLSDNALGRFLFMEDGVIHRQSLKDDNSSLIEFAAYGFDLTTFGQRSSTPTFRPAERPTLYLLDPDPEDSYFQEYPDRFMAEFHERLATPLYSLIFAFIPLAFLGQAQSTRRDRTASILMTTLTAAVTRGVSIVFAGIAEGPIVIAALYLLPFITAVLAIIALHSRFPLIAAESAMRLFDSVTRPLAWLRRRTRRPAPAA